MTSPAIRLRFRLHVFRIFSVLYLFPALLKNTRARRSQRTKFLISSFPYKLEGKWAAQFKSSCNPLQNCWDTKQVHAFPFLFQKYKTQHFQHWSGGAGDTIQLKCPKYFFPGLWLKPYKEKKHTQKNWVKLERSLSSQRSIAIFRFPVLKWERPLPLLLPSNSVLLRDLSQVKTIKNHGL